MITKSVSHLFFRFRFITEILVYISNLFLFLNSFENLNISSLQASPRIHQNKIDFFSEQITAYYKVQQYSGRSQQLGIPVQSRPGSIIFSEFLGPGWADLAMAS